MQNIKHYFVWHAMTFGAKLQASFDENMDEMISGFLVLGNLPSGGSHVQHRNKKK
jgi:hypothetical protein